MVATNANEDKPRRLIVFDVEGVLLPGRLLFEAARRLGFSVFVRAVTLGVLYELGLLSLESALKRVFRLFRGFTVDDFFQLYKTVPLMPGVEDIFEKLKEAGCRTALISSGLPTPFVEDLAARLKADRGVGMELGINEGRLTGEVAGDLIKPNGKRFALEEILDDEGLSPQDCVVVADDRNNLPMFPLCAVSIGYNPDFLVSAKSDFAVKGDLSEILPLLVGDAPRVPRSPLSRREALREAIHVSGFLVPFVCKYLLDRYLVSLVIFLVVLLYGASEFARLEGTNFPLFSTVTWRVAIQPELYKFATDPIFFALGIAFSLILFPAPVSYASIAILTLGDSSATIFGKRLGRIVLPFNKAKRLEGSALSFLPALAGALLFVSPVEALVAAAVGMLVECLPTPFSDNLTVPMASGLVLSVLRFFLGFSLT